MSFRFFGIGYGCSSFVLNSQIHLDIWFMFYTVSISIWHCSRFGLVKVNRKFNPAEPWNSVFCCSFLNWFCIVIAFLHCVYISRMLVLILITHWATGARQGLGMWHLLSFTIVSLYRVILQNRTRELPPWSILHVNIRFFYFSYC